MEKIYVFKRFERFWHWSQALLIIVMIVTGFEIRGTWSLLGFRQALAWHEIAAFILMGLWIFAIFWHFTTGEWRQYIPTSDKLAAALRFYFVGIFRGEPHPFRPTVVQKHNPLQRLGYFVLKLVMLPLIWISGLLLLFYADWVRFGIAVNHDLVVILHVTGAFMMAVFFIIHLYLITTGHTIGAHLKAMITGYEEVELQSEKSSKG